MESHPLPRYIVKYLTHGIVCLLDLDMYILYSDREQFAKALSNYDKDEEKVKSVVRSSLSSDHHHLFDSAVTVYRGYLNICAQFHKDTRLERRAVKLKTKKLKCRELWTYVNRFKLLLH